MADLLMALGKHLPDRGHQHVLDSVCIASACSIAPARNEQLQDSAQAAQQRSEVARQAGI